MFRTDDYEPDSEDNILTPQPTRQFYRNADWRTDDYEPSPDLDPGITLGTKPYRGDNACMKMSALKGIFSEAGLLVDDNTARQIIEGLNNAGFIKANIYKAFSQG